LDNLTGLDTLSLLAIPLAFIVGFALRRGSVCMVEGAKQAVVNRRGLRLRAYAVAAAAAGFVVLPLSWVLPGTGMLAPDFPPTWTIVLGGALFGLGARINGGCQFGTLARLAGGELDFAVTCIAGAAVAVLMPQVLLPAAPRASVLETPTLAGVLVLALFLALAAPALRRRYWRNLRRALTSRTAVLSPIPGMLVVGTVGGVLYAVAGSWTVGALLNREGAWLLGDAASHADIKAIAGGAALLAGAVYAALWTGKFRLRAPTIGALTHHLPGGMLMGAGAAMIPGGNGTLLLYAMPSASASAWIAFVAMTAMIVLTFLPLRARRAAAR